jgi:hypothetical protein
VTTQCSILAGLICQNADTPGQEARRVPSLKIAVVTAFAGILARGAERTADDWQHSLDGEVTVVSLAGARPPGGGTVPVAARHFAFMGCWPAGPIILNRAGYRGQRWNVASNCHIGVVGKFALVGLVLARLMAVRDIDDRGTTNHWPKCITWTVRRRDSPSAGLDMCATAV